ncbi:MAG: erythromycin esterase family protein [Verrucomicrobiales bacterium]|nr:erythromycin esterase family protein [Verrucomicrobiales bacterium]
MLALALVVTRGTVAQTDPALARELSEAAQPIRLFPDRNADSDLRPLKEWVGDRRLVALGEPTHGTREPLALRNQLFQLLVQESGFTAIALETGFSESKAVQNYIDGGPGEPRELLRQQLSWGFGGFPENLALVEWMRAYNADPGHRRKLRFYGIDLSGAGDGAFPRARRAVEFALEALEARGDAEVKKLRQEFEPLLPRFSSARCSERSETERQMFLLGLSRITHALEVCKASAPSDDRAAREELAWALQSVEVARQLHRMFDVFPVESGPGPGIPPEAWRAMEARDQGMAENVRWAFEAEGANGKLLVFAHNLHVMNAKITGGVWSTLKQPPAAMGLHLRQFFGRKICVVGTSAAEVAGGQSAFTVDPRSWDAAFAGATSRQFLFPTRSPQFSAAMVRWLDESRPLHANLSTEILVAAGQAFDAIVFLRELTPSATH